MTTSTSQFRTLLAAVALLVLAAAASAGEWPSWRGPHQDGVADDTGLITSWSRDGKNLVWRVDFIGRSTPAVFSGRVCATGRRGEGIMRQETVACFDAGDGHKLWEHPYNVYNTTVPFNRVGWASLTADPETGYVYAQGVGGTFLCLDADGKLVWSRTLDEELGRASGYGGRTPTPLVYQDLLIVNIINSAWGKLGPPRHRYYAFDKRTGEIVWIASADDKFEDANTQSNPIVTVVDGKDLLVGGNADGAVYALRPRTGERVWKFRLSKRGLNASVVSDGKYVYASHSEENVDAPSMGRVVAIDAKGSGDITATNEVWRADEIPAGFATPALKDGHLYVVDNSATLYDLSAKDGKLAWKLDLGTVGKSGPVVADGRLYATEVNGLFHVIEPGEKQARIVDTVELKVPDGRYAETYGSPAIAYGRIYFMTEEGLYCLGDKARPFEAKATPPVPKPEPAATPGELTALLAAPAEVLLTPGQTLSFEAIGFDANGTRLPSVSVNWIVDGLIGELVSEGRFTASAKVPFQVGEVIARSGALTASARVRVSSPLPWHEDFESWAPAKQIPYWIGSKHWKVAELDGQKVLEKPFVEAGLDRATTYLGPSNLKDYTIAMDVRGTAKGRRRPDIGLVNSGYTLELMGAHQLLRIHSWAATLRMMQSVPLKWEPDVWYTMKLRVDAGGDKAIIRGKVWPRAEPEPEAWTLTAEDPLPIRQGSPGIHGYSPTTIYYDNLVVKVNE